MYLFRIIRFIRQNSSKERKKETNVTTNIMFHHPLVNRD